MAVDWDHIAHQIAQILLEEGVQATQDPALRSATDEISRLTREALRAVHDNPEDSAAMMDLQDLRRMSTTVLNAHQVSLEGSAWRTFDRVMAALIKGILLGLEAA